MACNEPVWFAMEARGFCLGFKCNKRLGHAGRHACSGNQRQPETFKLEPYTILWGKDAEQTGAVRDGRGSAAA